jgi:hypothetical protein
LWEGGPRRRLNGLLRLALPALTFVDREGQGDESKVARLDKMLRRLIYLSRSLVGADPSALEPIVSSSIARNAEADVTGMLWADGQNFAQVIEGDFAEISETMDRIRADHRHTDLVVLLDRPVSSRQFGDWSMRLAADDVESSHATTFMIGFAMGERSASAKRLYEIIVASDSSAT